MLAMSSAALNINVMPARHVSSTFDLFCVLVFSSFFLIRHRVAIVSEHEQQVNTQATNNIDNECAGACTHQRKEP